MKTFLILLAVVLCDKGAVNKNFEPELSDIEQCITQTLDLESLDRVSMPLPSEKVLLVCANSIKKCLQDSIGRYDIGNLKIHRKKDSAEVKIVNNALLWLYQVNYSISFTKFSFSENGNHADVHLTSRCEYYDSSYFHFYAKIKLTKNGRLWHVEKVEVTEIDYCYSVVNDNFKY